MQNTRDPLGLTHDLDRLTINHEDLPQAHLAQAEAYQRVRVQLRERDNEIADLKQLIQKFNQKASDQADDIFNISCSRQFDNVNFGVQILLLEAKLDGKDIQLALTKDDLKETQRNLEKTKEEHQTVKKELESEDTHARIIESHLARAVQEKFNLAAKVKALSSVQKENEEQHEEISFLTKHLQTEQENSNRLSMKVKAMRDVYKNNTELHDRLRTLTKALQEEQGETVKLSEENKALLALQAQFTEAMESDNEEETTQLRAKLTESKALFSQLQSKHEELVEQLQESKDKNSELKSKIADSKEALSKLQDTIRVYVCQVSKGSIQHNEDRMRLLQLENTVLGHETTIEQLKNANKGCADELSQAYNTLEREAAAHSALKEKNSTFLRDIIAHEETISTLRMEATKAEQEIKWYSMHQDAGMLANIKLHKKFESLAAEFECLTAKCNSQAEEISTNQNTIATLHEKNSIANEEYQTEETIRLKDIIQDLENAARDSTADAERERQAAESKNEEQVEEIKVLGSRLQELEDAAIDTKRALETMESNLSQSKHQVLEITKARDWHIRWFTKKTEKQNEELVNAKNLGCQLTRQVTQKIAIINSLKRIASHLQEEKASLGTKNMTLEHTISSLKLTLQQKLKEGQAQTDRHEVQKAALEKELTTTKIKLEKKISKIKAYVDLLEDDNSLLKLRLKRIDKDQKYRIKKEKEWNAVVQSELDKIKVALCAENDAYKKRVAQLEARYEDRSWEFEGSDLDALEGAEDVRDAQLPGVKGADGAYEVVSLGPEVEGGVDNSVSSEPEVKSASNDAEASGPEVKCASDDDESDMGLESGSDNSVA